MGRRCRRSSNMDWDNLTPTHPPLKITVPTPEHLQEAQAKKPDANSWDALTPVKDFVAYTKKNFNEGAETITKPYEKDATAGWDTLQRVGDIGGKALGVAQMATAPAGGVKHALISKPLERAANVPADWTDLALAFSPAAAGAAAGTATRVAKAIPGGTKALGAVSKAVKDNPLVKATQEIVSPTTMSADAGKAEGIVREQRGLAERSTEQLKARLDPDTEYLSR